MFRTGRPIRSVILESPEDYCHCRKLATPWTPMLDTRLALTVGVSYDVCGGTTAIGLWTKTRPSVRIASAAITSIVASIAIDAA